MQDESAVYSNPGKVSVQAASLLYAGEHFDFSSQQYYNRARWYNPLSGRFNRVDPYNGNMHDPQSLHKYLYCHANPINNIDPSGQFALSISGLSTVMSIGIVIAAVTATVLVGLDLFAERGPDPWTLLRDPIVNIELRIAYANSNVGGLNPRENGGTILRVYRGSFRVIRWATGAAAQIMPLNVPTGRIGNDKVVGSFHTHPNVGPGWQQSPSDADLRWFGSNKNSAGNVHFVLSRDRVYVILRSSTFGRTKWKDFAPSLGNIRQERTGVFDEI